MRIDHVGIAVRDLDEAVRFYEEALGLELKHREEVAAQNVRVAFLADPRDPEGAAQVELLEPMGEEGAVARFLSAKGPGMHHLAFRVEGRRKSQRPLDTAELRPGRRAEGLAGEMERLRREGRPPLDHAPRPGARGHSVCFLHPKHCRGVLIELVEGREP